MRGDFVSRSFSPNGLVNVTHSPDFANCLGHEVCISAAGCTTWAMVKECVVLDYKIFTIR